VIYKQSIIDIIEELIASLSFTVQVQASVNNLNGTQTIAVCDIFHAQPGFIITIGPDIYTITAINAQANTITLSPAAPLIAAPSTFSLYAPFFFHGTPPETNTELADERDAFAKTPMVYLLETLTEEFNEDQENTVERVSSLRLFFLTQANFSKWLTADFYNNAIEPMRRLMENFYEAMRTSRRFYTKEQEFSITNHARFGIYISSRGVEKSLFVDNLSGVEMIIDLTILKDRACPPC